MPDTSSLSGNEKKKKIALIIVSGIVTVFLIVLAIVKLKEKFDARNVTSSSTSGTALSQETGTKKFSFSDWFNNLYNKTKGSKLASEADKTNEQIKNGTGVNIKDVLSGKPIDINAVKVGGPAGLGINGGTSENGISVFDSDKATVLGSDGKPVEPTDIADSVMNARLEAESVASDIKPKSEQSFLDPNVVVSAVKTFEVKVNAIASQISALDSKFVTSNLYATQTQQTLNSTLPLNTTLIDPKTTLNFGGDLTIESTLNVAKSNLNIIENRTVIAKKIILLAKGIHDCHSCYNLDLPTGWDLDKIVDWLLRVADWLLDSLIENMLVMEDWHHEYEYVIKAAQIYAMDVRVFVHPGESNYEEGKAKIIGSLVACDQNPNDAHHIKPELMIVYGPTNNYELGTKRLTQPFFTSGNSTCVPQNFRIADLAVEPNWYFWIVDTRVRDSRGLYYRYIGPMQFKSLAHIEVPTGNLDIQEFIELRDSDLAPTSDITIKDGPQARAEYFFLTQLTPYYVRSQSFISEEDCKKVAELFSSTNGYLTTQKPLAPTCYELDPVKNIRYAQFLPRISVDTQKTKFESNASKDGLGNINLTFWLDTGLTGREVGIKILFNELTADENPDKGSLGEVWRTTTFDSAKKVSEPKSKDISIANRKANTNYELIFVDVDTDAEYARWNMGTQVPVDYNGGSGSVDLSKIGELGIDADLKSKSGFGLGGEGGFIKCGNKGEKMCDYNDLMDLVQVAVSWIFVLALPLLAIGCAVTGVKLILAQGSGGELSKAKDNLFNFIKGFALAAFAWVIVASGFKFIGLRDNYILLDLRPGNNKALNGDKTKPQTPETPDKPVTPQEPKTPDPTKPKK
jgi:hypothetical protein